MQTRRASGRSLCARKRSDWLAGSTVLFLFSFICVTCTGHTTREGLNITVGLQINIREEKQTRLLLYNIYVAYIYFEYIL